MISIRIAVRRRQIANKKLNGDVNAQKEKKMKMHSKPYMSHH